MISFDRGFEPPALAIPVQLTGVVHARPKVDVQAIIDTGADISAVPENLGERLNLYRFGQIQLEDARAVNEPAYTYEANIGLIDQSPITLEVILTPFPFVILGRDWIQYYYLALKGPEQIFSLGSNFQEILDSLNQA